MKRKSIFLLIVLVYACAPSEEKSDNNINDGMYHKWKQTEISYYINREANVQTELAIKFAFTLWQNAIGSKLKFDYKGRNDAGLIRDGKNTVSFLIRWSKGISASKIAYCRKWYDTNGAIIESDIIFNMKLAKFTTMTTNSDDSYYVEGICAHEIGHMLGLAHINRDASIMNEILGIKGSMRAEIDAYAIDSFWNIYGD